MAIDFQCADCGRAIRSQAEHAGKRVRCPHCQSVQTVPGGPSAAAPPSRPAPRPAVQPAQPAPGPAPPNDAGFAIDPAANTGGPVVGTNPSVSSRFRKSAKNATQNGIGSLVCAFLGLAANVLCCCGAIIPFLPLMFEGAMAVIGIMLALNSRSGWKIAGLILNIAILVWTVTIFLLILGGLTLNDVRQMQ